MVASMTFESPTAESRPLLQGKQQTLVTIASFHETADEPEPVATEELQTLLELVYPVVGTTALEFLPGMTCIVLAGHMDSPKTQQYVDAATLSTMLMNLTNYSVCFGLSSALDTLCSQAYGARRYEKIGMYFQAGVIVLSACFLPIFLLNWYTQWVMVSLGQDEEVSRLAQSFSRWMLLGMPFIILYELVRKVLQAQNIMKPLISIATVGNVLNIVSGYWLAYYTSMGFEGIALSRSLGNIAMALLLVPYFAYHPHHLSQWWRGWDVKEALAHVWLFLRLGFPGMVMMCLEWTAFELLTLMAGVLPDGIVAMSAHSVLVNINSIIYVVFSGLAVAVNIRVGHCLGANAPKQTKVVTTVSLSLTLVISLVCIVGLYSMRWSLPKLLLNDPESIARAAHALAAWAPLEILDGQNTVLQGIFRGAGKQKVGAIINAVAYYIFGTPAAALLAFSFALNVEGLWLGFGFGIFVSAVALSYLLFERWTWEELADDAQQRTAE